MTGVGICSDNYIRMRKLQGKLDDVATETISEVDAQLDKKNEGTKLMNRRIINSQHDALKHKTHRVNLCISTHTKVYIAAKINMI